MERQLRCYVRGSLSHPVPADSRNQGGPSAGVRRPEMNKMRCRASCCFLIVFGFVLGCSQHNYKTAGFAGDQDRFLPASRDYDQRECVDDSIDFNNGNFDPDDPFEYW